MVGNKKNKMPLNGVKGVYLPAGASFVGPRDGVPSEQQDIAEPRRKWTASTCKLTLLLLRRSECILENLQCKTSRRKFKISRNDSIS